MPRFQGVWLRNVELDGVHYVPDDPRVLRSFEARGWEKTDLPADLDDDDPDFIEALEKLKADESKAAKSKKSATKEEEVK